MKEIINYCECDFCNEIKGKDNLYWDIAKKNNLTYDRKIYEGRNWIILPTIGAIVPGYVLIVSKRHFFSTKDCNKEEMIELEIIIRQIRKILKKIYHYSCIAFEHGSCSGIINKPSCIDHCHLHVLPLREDIIYRVNKQKYEIKGLESLNCLITTHKDDLPYLLYQNHDEKYFIINAQIYISQYFRQLIAISEGIPDKWDWRHYYFQNNIIKTLNDVKSEMKNGLITY